MADSLGRKTVQSMAGVGLSRVPGLKEICWRTKRKC